MFLATFMGPAIPGCSERSKPTQAAGTQSISRQPSEQAATSLQVYTKVVNDQTTMWRDCSLRTYPLGKLSLPTGKIVACDPFVDPDKAVDLDMTVPAGSYSIDLIIGRRPSGDERITFCPWHSLDLAVGCSQGLGEPERGP